MSEYQYYEFQAIDRRLTKQEMDKLRSYSTRATITPTSFTNEYYGGDFRGKEEVWMERYFDAFLYYANWGSRRFMLRLPLSLLDPAIARDYLAGEDSSLSVKGDKVILTFGLENEPGESEWEGDEDQLSALLPIREELVKGDLRALYIGWLGDHRIRFADETAATFDREIEPPVPAGLKELTDAQQSLVSFLEIDEDVLAVAAEASPVREVEIAPQHMDLLTWLAKLPASEKDELLAQFMTPESDASGALLFRRFLRERSDRGPKLVSPDGARRSLGALLRAAEQRGQERKRIAAAKAEKKRQQQARAAELARKQRLDAIEGSEAELWRTIEAFAESKLPKNYDQAIELLVDLRDLAARQGKSPDFQSRLDVFCATHRRKPTLLERVNDRVLPARKG